MLNFITPPQDALSDKEKVFYGKGFDCFPKGEGAVCFRQFFMVKELAPILATRLKRMGVRPEDDISICYSESDNLVSACVLKRDVFMEHEATSPEGVSLLWAFGIQL